MLAAKLIPISPFSEVIDNFERGNLNPYDTNLADHYAISTERSFIGVYSCKATTQDHTWGIRLFSTTGLRTYFPRGFRLSMRFNLHDNFSLTGAMVGLLFGLADNSDNYLFQINSRDEELKLVRRLGGSNTDLGLEAISRSDFVKNEWLKATIDWKTDNSMTAYLHRADGTLLGSVSGSDSSFASNTGVGIFTNSSSSSPRDAYFDQIQIDKAL